MRPIVKANLPNEPFVFDEGPARSSKFKNAGNRSLSINQF